MFAKLNEWPKKNDEVYALLFTVINGALKLAVNVIQFHLAVGHSSSDPH